MRSFLLILLSCVVLDSRAQENPPVSPLGSAGSVSPSVGGTKTSAVQHWSFQELHCPPVPATRNTQWIRNPIDAFVLARLEKANLEPSPEADRPTLLRRLSLDLLGLPPSPDDVHAFVRDRRADAYEECVDRLLASPHFGEHWGRHWLDLARYADSDGYEKDSPRPYAYLYRDWVIDAVNRDLPFDQFSLEQLAGDLLSSATEDQKIATGFHRNTLTNKEGGVDQEEFRCKATVDRVSTTGTVWLGLTVGCAECHSHKYDPISQREFYQFYAFFNDASEKDIPAPRHMELARYNAAKKKWNSEQTRLKSALAACLKNELRSKETGEEVDADTARLERELAAHAAKEPKYPETKAQVMTAQSPPRETHVHIRGDFLRPGDLVEPGTPAVLPPFKPRAGRGDRLDLARWLFAPDNPLTARVSVNRVWYHLFGRGLVTTLNDFGARGERPSHPELLDWLAAEFRRLGWSRKELIKLIVTSSTYRQSSRARPDLAERDPNNDLLARQNRFRLDAENVRDACLRVSGLLNPEVGGPSIRPPLPADIAALGYANSVKWRESQGAERNRRGLYIFFQRTVPYPMLATFDAPDSNATCTRRERSNTPLQALTLLNDPVFFECAQALGERLARDETQDRQGKLERGFQTCLSRKPTAEERERLEKLYGDYIRLAQLHPEAAARIPANSKAGRERAAETTAWIGIGRILLNLDEFVTRE